MTLPTLTEHAAVGYAASHGSAAWTALSSTEQRSIMAKHLYGLNYLVSGNGDQGAAGVLVTASPGDPLPQSPGP